MLSLLKRLFREEEGQGLVEYALIIALIAVVLILSLTNVGTAIRDKFNDIISGLGGTTVTP